MENIFSRDPDNADGRLLQAQVWLAKGEPSKAVSALEKVDRTYPNNPLIKLHLARAYVANKDAEKARVALEQAISSKPDFTEAVLSLAELNLRSGKAQAAVGPLEELRKRRPDLPQVRILLASAYQLLGRLDDAASIFREQAEQNPQAPDAHFFLGVILRQQKKDSHARKEFEKALELKPDNWLAIDNLTEMDIVDKQYDLAIERAQRYVEKKPDLAPGHYLLGKIYAARQDWPKAEAELKKTLDLDPNFGLAYNGLVSIYVAQKKLPQAISEVEGVLKQQPDNGRALLTLALLQEQMKDYSKARDAYEKVLKVSPDTVVALNNLSYLYAERFHQLDRAYELAQKAHNLQSDNASINDSLGWILYERGDYQQALPLLQESVGKLPDNPEVQYHLGMTASMMGQAEIARVALKKAADSTVDFPGKQEAQQRLAALSHSTGSTTSESSSNVVALTRHAEDLEKNGEPAKAAEAYEEALKLNPKLPDVPLKLAQLYAGPLHNRERALEFAKNARALAPNDTKSAAVLGRLALQSGNYSWAYSLLRETVRRGSTDPAVLHDFAMATYALGNVPDARRTMNRLLEANPDPNLANEAKMFLEMTALEQPSPETMAAKPEIDNALNREPDYVPALMARAAIQLQQNDHKAATDNYQKVLQKYSDFAPAQKRLAALYAETPETLTKAYDLAMKARKVLPNDTDLALTFGEISYQRKEFPYAIQLFQQAAAKQSLPAKDLFYLGMAQLQTRQAANGRETLDRALKAGLSGSLADEAKKRLAEQPQR